MNTFPDLIARKIGWYIWDNKRWNIVEEYQRRVHCWFPSARDFRLVWQNEDGKIGTFQWRSGLFFANQWIHNCKRGKINWLVPEGYLDGIGARRETQNGMKKGDELRYDVGNF